MKRFLDTSVLVEACLTESAHFDNADKLVNQPGAVTSAHALAELYSTLSGNPRFNIRTVDAAQMVVDLAAALTVLTLSPSQYRELIASAPGKGIRGGTIYDAIHADIARRAGCGEIHTLNVNHFKHVAPDLKVMAL